ncbi:hypothetical protein FG386_002557 [Cryptosporidium ryanae]|uniref:uncharacterized protein n=1 Tax=Cryptosporidium ryanae TaxID=515981 RepID=UPI003519F8D3|nr:hypothetical protein FG386_002557 [Cryptosporidium ryanae]
MRNLCRNLFVFGVNLFLSYLVSVSCNSRIDGLLELRKSVLEHEKELEKIHGITSNLVGETGDALKFSKKRPIFNELSKAPVEGIQTTSIKMTLKFPNTAPVSVDQGRLREDIKNTASGKGQSIPTINPIPLVMIRPDALTNLLASLSATVHQRKKIEGKSFKIYIVLLNNCLLY